MEDVSPFSCQYNVFAKQGPEGPTLRFQYGGPLTGNDKFYFTLAGEGALWVSYASEALGDWHHYAFVWSAGQRRIYLDGALLGSDDGASASTLTGTFFLGHNSGTTYGFREHFEGEMDDLRIYSRALSATEVTKLVAAKDDPQNADECKNGGWISFGFENQGRCIQFVNTGKDSRSE
jgi:hypothetical protein